MERKNKLKLQQDYRWTLWKSFRSQMKVKVLVWLFETLKDCSPRGSSVHGILQARILEWVDISSSKGSSWPRDWTRVSCIAGRFLTIWASTPRLALQISLIKPRCIYTSSPLDGRCTIFIAVSGSQKHFALCLLLPFKDLGHPQKQHIEWSNSIYFKNNKSFISNIYY